MSKDHFKFVSTAAAPVFLSVKAGMTVICGSSDSDDWWMADVLHVDGGARAPKVPTLFQVRMFTSPCNLVELLLDEREFIRRF
jgi:hypothetical protein